MLSLKRTVSAAVAALGVAAASTAHAALPPYYQRALEFETILKNAEVARALAGKGPIDSVSRVGEDAYEIEAGSCTLGVMVVTDSEAEAVPGPRRIKLEVGAPKCR